MFLSHKLFQKLRKMFFRLVTSAGQRNNSESPWGIEPQTFRFRAPMLYHWAIETPRSITKFIFPFSHARHTTKIIFLYILFVLCSIDIDFEEEYQSTQDILNFHFPVVQADITECATYAVVSRLHLSPEFTITSNGGSFVMPEYPSVSVTIPKKAVTSKTRIPLRLKVQNFPEI